MPCALTLNRLNKPCSRQHGACIAPHVGAIAMVTIPALAHVSTPVHTFLPGLPVTVRPVSICVPNCLRGLKRGVSSVQLENGLSPEASGRTDGKSVDGQWARVYPYGWGSEAGALGLVWPRCAHITRHPRHPCLPFPHIPLNLKHRWQLPDAPNPCGTGATGATSTVPQHSGASAGRRVAQMSAFLFRVVCRQYT